MCGITVLIRPSIVRQDTDTTLESSYWQKLLKSNAARGPDSQHAVDLIIPTSTAKGDVPVSISFVASTLHLRGTTLVPQPQTSEKSIFCWNGEVFEGLDVCLSRFGQCKASATNTKFNKLPAESNDSAVLFAALDKLEQPEDIYTFISNIEGPYAFVYYQRAAQRLFFARDPLGRRSLLIHRPVGSNTSLILSSVSAGTGKDYHIDEVDPQFIYSMDVRHLYVLENEVAFQRVICARDRTTLRGSPLFAQLARVNRTISDVPKVISFVDPLPDVLNTAVDQFLDILDTSVRTRVQNIPRSSPPHQARVAVLYSGGIDSTMVAFLANRHVPLDEPIDLLNVAFENPRKLQGRQSSGGQSKRRNKILLQSKPFDKDIYEVPDRISGLEELEELRQLCPGRQWNFVEIDIDYVQSSQAKGLVEEIMLPSRTVMDLSLALALYFAARGVGTIRRPSCDLPEAYISPARVLLNGLGADELLGGYGRHRSAFNTGSWDRLIDELQLELDRLPSRNLGRDDRVISCHGKETRHPFLSLSVVDFLANLPVYFKIDPRLEVGMGDKMLLRLGARKLGLEKASQRKKRAMQFGSHSARMEGVIKERVTDRILSAEN